MKRRKRRQAKKPEVVEALPARRADSDFWMDPFNIFRGFQERMSELLRVPFFEEARRGLTERIYSPRIDVYEEGKNVVVKAGVPGAKKEEISVSVTEDSVTVKGERKQAREEKGKDYYRNECAYGSFQRMVGLPHRVKGKEAKAKYENGVLTIRIPKAKGEEANPAEIKVE